MYLMKLEDKTDLVDNVGSRSVFRRCPWSAGAGQVPLQTFDKTHEVPDGEDVKAHEMLHSFDGVDASVDFVSEQLVLKRLDRSLKSRSEKKITIKFSSCKLKTYWLLIL